jgi:hypothetical protein
VAFSQHLFFTRLSSAELPVMRKFASALGFWVMAFQDILRKNHELVSDVRLRQIAHHHMREDAGHERWFLADLERLGAPPRDLGSIFDRRSRRVRDASFALASEVFRAEHDELRIVLLIVLEAAGRVFFERIADRVDEFGPHHGLRYFARSHLEVEQDHDLHSAESSSMLRAISLPAPLDRQAIALVNRGFNAFHEILTGLVEAADRDTRTSKTQAGEDSGDPEQPAESGVRVVEGANKLTLGEVVWR